jgi:acyl carrier protein
MAPASAFSEEFEVLRDEIVRLKAPLSLDVTPLSNALELGLDSLDFVEIYDAVERHFGCELPIEKWFVREGETSTPRTDAFLLERIASFIHQHRRPDRTAVTEATHA